MRRTRSVSAQLGPLVTAEHMRRCTMRAPSNGSGLSSCAPQLCTTCWMLGRPEFAMIGHPRTVYQVAGRGERLPGWQVRRWAQELAVCTQLVGLPADPSSDQRPLRPQWPVCGRCTLILGTSVGVKGIERCTMHSVRVKAQKNGVHALHVRSTHDTTAIIESSHFTDDTILQ